ncbi:MAG: ribosomal protein S18-alanine N-acetyltransferase [Desulfatibacillaceae bacterium]
MRTDDLESVRDLERLSFSSPWTANLIAHELAVPGSRTLVVRESSDNYPTSVIAYASFRVAAGEMQLMRIAVHPLRRRSGIGEQLHQACLRRAARAGAGYVVLEVRAANTPAKAFYEKAGYRLVGQRPNYYVETGETALIYQLELREET